jgi:hypothetical protein
MHVPGRFINDAHHRIDRAGATPLNPGSIFFDEDFKFHDGQAGEKVFLVLGTLGAVSLVAKTTQHGRGVSFGCQPKDRFHNFYLPPGSCYRAPKSNTGLRTCYTTLQND